MRTSTSRLTMFLLGIGSAATLVLIVLAGIWVTNRLGAPQPDPQTVAAGVPQATMPPPPRPPMSTLTPVPPTATPIPTPAPTSVEPTLTPAPAEPTLTPAPIAPTSPPSVAPTLAPAPEPIPLAGQIDPLLDSVGGIVSAAAFDETRGEFFYTRNLEDSFIAASLIKLPIALAAYDLAAQGALNLDEQLTMRAEDIVGGTGNIQNSPPGTSYSIRELCARMLADSDNTAANMVTRRIGGFEIVNALMDRLGAQNTRMQRFLMDFEAQARGQENVTSPGDMLLLLQVVESGPIFGITNASELFTAMTRTSDRHKIPALLPPDALVANKTGVLPSEGIEHDIGIIVTPSGRRYLLVLMASGLPNNQSGIEVFAQASQIIYGYQQGLGQP